MMLPSACWSFTRKLFTALLSCQLNLKFSLNIYQAQFLSFLCKLVKMCHYRTQLRFLFPDAPVFQLRNLYSYLSDKEILRNKMNMNWHSQSTLWNYFLFVKQNKVQMLNVFPFLWLLLCVVMYNTDQWRRLKWSKEQKKIKNNYSQLFIVWLQRELSGILFWLER